ncbi:MAG: class II fructose-bisphosphate aldolase [Phycisphaerae bacterium]|nr:class II fructose-bisphosphate aldolase [Phycisphaerae bacterium]
MLTTLVEVLADARKNGYAVPAFDCVEDVMVRAILETCEQVRSPVVLMCLVGADLEGNGWAYVPGLVKAVGDFHSVPVVLHLDHATKLESIKTAIGCGFTSVMIDGSMLPFDKNAEITKATAEMAHRKGISVEGELGWVGGFDLQAKDTGRPVLTEAREVEKFVSTTGVDALAVSIGTSHGVYESLPNLDIERLRELNEASSVPLVLHGGSGTPSDQIREAVKSGICKMNIYADNRIAMARGLKISAESQTRPDPPVRELFGPIKEEVAKVVKEKIELLLSAGRV